MTPAEQQVIEPMGIVEPVWTMPRPRFKWLCLLGHRWRRNPDWPAQAYQWPWVCIRCWHQGRLYA